MRKKYEELMDRINEGKYTGREIILAGMVLFLTGTLIGIFFSPKKHQVIGSNNGSNNSDNGNNNGEVPAPDKKNNKNKKKNTEE